MGQFEERLANTFKDYSTLILETLQMESYVFSTHACPSFNEKPFTITQLDLSTSDWDLPFMGFSGEDLKGYLLPVFFQEMADNLRKWR